MSATTSSHDPLRPRTLAEFGGQPDLVTELDIVLSGARARKELAPHLLFAGPPPRKRPPPPPVWPGPPGAGKAAPARNRPRRARPAARRHVRPGRRQARRPRRTARLPDRAGRRLHRRDPPPRTTRGRDALHR